MSIIVVEEIEIGSLSRMSVNRAIFECQVLCECRNSVPLTNCFLCANRSFTTLVAKCISLSVIETPKRKFQYNMPLATFGSGLVPYSTLSMF